MQKTNHQHKRDSLGALTFTTPCLASAIAPFSRFRVGNYPNVLLATLRLSRSLSFSLLLISPVITRSSLIPSPLLRLNYYFLPLSLLLICRFLPPLLLRLSSLLHYHLFPRLSMIFTLSLAIVLHVSLLFTASPFTSSSLTTFMSSRTSLCNHLFSLCTLRPFLIKSLIVSYAFLITFFTAFDRLKGKGCV